VAVVGLVLLVELDGAHDLAVCLDRKARLEPIDGFIIRGDRPEPPGDLGLDEDLDDTSAVALLQRPQRHALPAERRPHGVVEVPVAPVAPPAA
jgi:hypothetical protein